MHDVSGDGDPIRMRSVANQTERSTGSSKAERGSDNNDCNNAKRAADANTTACSHITAGGRTRSPGNSAGGCDNSAKRGAGLGRAVAA